MKKIIYDVKNISSPDANTPLILFLSDWMSDNCSGPVNVSSIITRETYTNARLSQIQATFESDEDATIIKLKGIPPLLSKYLTIH